MNATLRVNEFFYSLQGEGARAGEPSLFIRLAGCDMTCGFCDTEFASGEELTPPELNAAIHEAGFAHAKWIVWTGGEPMLQLNLAIVAYFAAAGFKQAIESNGNHPIPTNLDWIVVSPKVAEHVLLKNFENGRIDELRYVRHKHQLAVPAPSVKASTYFLSPLFKGNQPDRENIEHCMKLCLANPPWRLSIQLHKLLNIL